MNRNSQKTMFNELEYDGIPIVNIWDSYEINDFFINEAYSFDVYITQDGDDWDKIAYKLYNDEHLWWLVLLSNGIQNPFLALDYLYKPGNEIRVLKEEYLQHILVKLEDLRK